MRRRRLISLTAPTLALVAFTAACGGTGGGGGLPVVATTSIVADIVENVGGEDVSMTTLVGTDSDAHTFEPEPADSVAIADAEIVFEVGRGFEQWLDAAVDASGSDAEVVALSDGIEPIAFADGDGSHSDEESGEDSHGRGDPHVWMTAANGIEMVETAAGALADADPDNAEAYRERAADYVRRLELTKVEVEATLEPIPPDRRVLFTNHDAFGYFAAEHGFEVLGSALSSVTTDGADPSAADVAAVVKEIRDSGAPAIFPENVANPELLETIARETGVAVGPELTTGALGETGTEAGSYIGLLRSNAESIAESLRG